MLDKIVITGGAGFIGSHIAEYWVQEGCDVHIIDNLKSGFRENIPFGTVFHQISISDREALTSVFRDALYVFHLAAMVSVEESMKNPLACIETNVRGTVNVLDAAIKGRVKKIVFSSSSAVYGEGGSLSKAENTLLNPKSPYGISKVDGEYWLNFYREQYGLSSASLRYFNVYGPRQSVQSDYAAVIPIFIRKTLEGREVTIHGDGEQTRDFIFVKDIVCANILAARDDHAQGIFNVGTGNSVSIISLAKHIKQLTGSQSAISFTDTRHGDIRHSVADVSRSSEILKFIPEFNLIQGLERTIDYFKVSQRP